MSPAPTPSDQDQIFLVVDDLPNLHRMITARPCGHGFNRTWVIGAQGPVGRFHLAVAPAGAGGVSEARRSPDRALRPQPESPETRRPLDRLGRSQAGGLTPARKG